MSVGDAAGRFELLLCGCGAIGSRFEVACADLGVAMTVCDNQRVSPENLGVAAFVEGDLYKDKAAVVAARRRARGGVGRAVQGDLRYTVRPGLASRIDAAVLCLDNPAAIHDAAESLWAGAPDGLPVAVLTCGGAEGGYQARLFVAPAGLCPVCLFGEADRKADRLGGETSCADPVADTSAPRASGAAAEAAAHTGAALLARWRAGDRALRNARVQRDGAGEGGEYVIRMPAAPRPSCPIPHARPGAQGTRIERLGAIASVTVGALAERAITAVGGDAEIVLGRRGVPVGGLYCPRCRETWSVPPLLMPAALAAPRPCACAAPPRALGERGRVEAGELLQPAVASLTLEAWGAGHGEELVAIGPGGGVRLRCAFDWQDLGP